MIAMDKLQQEGLLQYNAISGEGITFNILKPDAQQLSWFQDVTQREAKPICTIGYRDNTIPPTPFTRLIIGK